MGAFDLLYTAVIDARVDAEANRARFEDDPMDYLLKLEKFADELAEIDTEEMIISELMALKWIILKDPEIHDRFAYYVTELVDAIYTSNPHYRELSYIKEDMEREYAERTL